MRSPIPSHAERIEICGLTAWFWETEHGWTVYQWPYQVDYSNYVEKGQAKHMADWLNHSPRKGEMEGGVVSLGNGYLDRKAFLVLTERTLEALRRENDSPIPRLRLDHTG